MTKKITVNQIELATNIFLLVSILLFISGASLHFQKKQGTEKPANQSTDTSTLVEREKAIEEAKKNGQKDYSFTSGFNPGIGSQ